MGKCERRENDIRKAVILMAAEMGLTICAAESCTGGLLGGALTDPPGASRVFLGSAVCYSNEAKIRILGVSPDILAQHGAVSEGCAAAMAAGARNLFLADIALSVTGVAGPDGGTKEKPIGRVWFSVDSGWQKEVFSCSFGGGRGEIREKAVEVALEALLTVIGRRRE